MNLRSKKLIIPAGAAAAVLVIGGTVWAAQGDDVSGSDRDRAGEAALAEVGEGTVTDIDAADDAEDPAFEVEVTRRDGSEVDVALDENFAVVFVDDDRQGDRRDDDAAASATPAPAPAPEATAVTPRVTDDVPLTGETKTKAEAAAVAAVGGGTALYSQQDDSDDGDRSIYEVDVRATDGTLWQIELDREFKVVDKDIED